MFSLQCFLQLSIFSFPNNRHLKSNSVRQNLADELAALNEKFRRSNAFILFVLCHHIHFGKTVIINLKIHETKNLKNLFAFCWKRVSVSC